MIWKAATTATTTTALQIFTFLSYLCWWRPLVKVIRIAAHVAVTTEFYLLTWRKQPGISCAVQHVNISFYSFVLLLRLNGHFNHEGIDVYLVHAGSVGFTPRSIPIVHHGCLRVWNDVKMYHLFWPVASLTEVIVFAKSPEFNTLWLMLPPTGYNWHHLQYLSSLSRQKAINHGPWLAFVCFLLSVKYQ